MADDTHCEECVTLEAFLKAWSFAGQF